jgi:hypothetical protein
VVKEAALALDIPVITPDSLKDPELPASLKDFAADIFVVVALSVIDCRPLDHLALANQLQPILCRAGFLGHNGNQLNTLFHIELVLLYRLAIETIGDLPQRMNVAGKPCRQACRVLVVWSPFSAASLTARRKA